MKNKYCEDCKHFKYHRGAIPTKYVRHHVDSFELHLHECFVCEHPTCFEKYYVNYFGDTGSVKLRKSGQAQLNHHNNCLYFEKKPWWKFW